MQAIESALGISRLDDDVAPLHVAKLAQPAPEGFDPARHSRRRGSTEVSDSGDVLRLLRISGERRGEEAPTQHPRERSSVNQGHAADYRADPDVNRGSSAVTQILAFARPLSREAPLKISSFGSGDVFAKRSVSSRLTCIHTRPQCHMSQCD